MVSDQSKISKPEIKVDDLINKFSEFGIFKNVGYYLLKMNQQLNGDSLAALNERCLFTETDPAQHFIVDCSVISDANPLWTRFLQEHQKRLTEKNFKLRLINVSPQFQETIKLKGLASTFQICTDLDTALETLDLKKKSKTFDVQVVNPFLAASINVVKSYSSHESTQGKIFLKHGGGSFSGDVSGVMHMDCPVFKGLFIVTFPKQTIFNIAGKMLGTTFTESNKMVFSAVGELANIIFSQGRKELNSKGYGIEISLPKIAETKECPTEFAEYKTTNIVVPFENYMGNFYTEIRL
jgi:CheY-specific phosphatase CheX/anti-anti-sigma regulatory factor